MMRKILFFITGVLLLAGCTGQTSTDKRPVVSVGVEPYRYFVNRIAGERFRVTVMVPPGSSPENYEPTPQQMLDLMNSRAYLAAGYIDFERTRLAQITGENPTLRVFDLSRGIEILRDADGHGADPHVWLSPHNAAVIAGNICEALCAVDSVNAGEFRRRTVELVLHIDSIDAQIKQQTADLARRSFLIYHPALAYFARDYGLRQLSVSSGGREASPAHMKALLEQSRAERASVLFVQKQYPASSMKQIARDAGARIVEIDPLAYEWDKEMLKISESLTK